MSNDTTGLMGPKICLMGLGGTGKTYSLGTLVEWAEANGHEVAILFTENSAETLLGYFRDKGKEPPACLYWHQQITKPITLAGLLRAADLVGKLSYEALAKSTDPERGGENNAFFKILSSCKDFVDDRTGKSLGPVDEFPMTRIFVVDSLTELANAAMKMQVGARPMASPGDYGVAQHNLLNLIRLYTQGMRASFVLIAHVDRELDPITQTTKLMMKSIGKALATELPTLFSEIIYTVRDGSNFYWDTAAFGVDVKTRSLGYRSKISPTFAQLFDTWKKRGGH